MQHLITSVATNHNATDHLMVDRNLLLKCNFFGIGLWFHRFLVRKPVWD